MGFTENIEPNLIKEIKKKLGRKEELNQFGFVDYEIPLHNPFVYQKHYSSFHSFEEYETDAIDEYKKFLQSYINLLKVSFKNHGYVSKRGAPYDFTLVRWLVDWTILQHSKEEILQDIKTETGEDLDNSTLNKHFRRFRTYDLPVR